MSMDQDKVIENYMTAVEGITGNVHDANLKAQLQTIFPRAFLFHCKYHPWEFLENAEETLTTTSAVYVTPTTIKVIMSAGIADSKAFNWISWNEYRDKVFRSDTTSSLPGEAAKYKGRIYPYPPPNSGLSIVVSGRMATDDPTSITALLAAIDGGHEPAIWALLDYYRKVTRSLADYYVIADALWADEEGGIDNAEEYIDDEWHEVSRVLTGQ